MMGTAGDQGPDGASSEGFLFPDVGLASPLEELRAIFEKRFRTAQNLGEEEKARAYRAAHDLARKKLAAALGEDT